MPIHHNISRVGQKPQTLQKGQLESEALLKEMIVAEPEIISLEWMIIGRQEDACYRGCIDLLPLAPDVTLNLIELKRDKRPRGMVAQVLDYTTHTDSMNIEHDPSVCSRSSNTVHVACDCCKPSIFNALNTPREAATPLFFARYLVEELLGKAM